MVFWLNMFCNDDATLRSAAVSEHAQFADELQCGFVEDSEANEYRCTFIRYHYASLCLALNVAVVVRLSASLYRCSGTYRHATDARGSIKYRSHIVVAYLHLSIRSDTSIIFNCIKHAY